MSALSPALGSIFSATNENYAALANVKFDFSLVKVEAPVEFEGIVSALSARRRVEAEEGTSHKTARRLGALFEDLVPVTPKLISACGKRMSEIMDTPGVNNVGTAQHGPFEPYVGADGTALWAAATSGTSALAIYLLSCLLARAWDAKVATAIWVELVAARRKEIEDELKNNHNISTSAIVGACQDITRKDLALWDSSARAWLRRADKAKEWSQCQLSLIVKNINAPIAGGPSTYEKVTDMWKRSMLAIEQFLSGKPQEILDGSVFLAFSAWHLYPNLLVLGAEPRKVDFNDKLIPSAGVGTVGVVTRTTKREGVQWSLALSHLQYYGDPIVVRSDQEYSRLTFFQLQIVAFGGLLGGWRISSRDFLSVAEWFKLLWSRMGLSEEEIKNGYSSEFGWLLQFVTAANQLLAANDRDHQQNIILLKHGSRRAKGFLSDQNCNPSPFFGLLNTLTMCGLQEKLDVDSGIAYLRAVADKLGLRICDAVICYAHDVLYANTSGYVRYFELAAVKKFESKVHVRWICPNGEANLPPPLGTHANFTNNNKDRQFILEHRIDYISGQGEKCELYTNGPDYASRTYDFSWSNPPAIYLQDGSTPTHGHDDATHQSKKVKVDMSFSAIVGDWRLGLFLRNEAHIPYHPLQSYQDKAKLEMSKAEKVSTGIQNFKDTELEPYRLRDYVCSLTYVSREQSKENSLIAPGVSMISSARRFQPAFSKSLYAIESASRIYSHLDKATISLKLMARPLSDSAWFQCLFKRWEPVYHKGHPWFIHTPLLSPQCPPLPDRHESFGCIALFDSGTVNLNPEDFEHSFALCSEDTIYVPMVILSDPFTEVPEYKMKSITGNISRPGVSILVSPFTPQIRELSGSYNMVAHETYDFKREDNFKETSLHLSFTDWTFPLASEGSRTIDHDAQVVEAVISVRDRGRGVGDIDILQVDFQGMIRFKPVPCCRESHDHDYDFDYTSIDSWEELLDEPNTVGIFRAHGNWAARLAAVSILSRNEAGGHNFGVLGPDSFCLRCLEEEFEKPGWNMLDYESTLPSFCID